MGCAAAVDGRLYVFASHFCYVYTPESHPRALALAEEYVQQRWMNEASDTLFDTRRFPRLAAWSEGEVLGGFRRFGERLAAQSEGAAAAVVYV